MAQTAAERRQAQRVLAKQIKTNTYQPSAIGKKARETAQKYRDEKKRIIALIRWFKNKKWGSRPRFHQRRSDLYARVNPETGREWTIEQLRDIQKMINENVLSPYDRDWHTLAAMVTEDERSSLFYH